MIKSIEDALKALKEKYDLNKYAITKKYVCSLANETYYAFRLCKIGVDDIPGLTSILVNVFGNGEISAGGQIMEPPGGKEVE